jgi:hypothetical protein
MPARFAIGAIAGKWVIGIAAAAALAVAGWFGYNFYQRAQLQIRLTDAVVEVIRLDSALEKQNEAVSGLADKGKAQNQEANNRALQKLYPEQEPEIEQQYGADAMNKWLEQWK